jgi:hypothetical protein
MRPFPTERRQRIDARLDLLDARRERVEQVVWRDLLAPQQADDFVGGAVDQGDINGHERDLFLLVLNAPKVSHVAVYPVCEPGTDTGHRNRREMRYVFNRYPVLKIHATMARKIARNSAVMPRLTSTSTSARP